VAKLETSLSVVGSNLELKLYGYNDKLSVLLSHILSASQSFSPKMDRFEVICFYAEDMIDYIEYKCGNVFFFSYVCLQLCTFSFNFHRKSG
jgi:secreted Zn-dependent insulinase-like peptidase